jgi:hypothetical protein
MQKYRVVEVLYNPIILDIGTRSEWSASRRCLFTPGTHGIS